MSATPPAIESPIELLRAREWRGETLSESDAAELRAFYDRLERIEEGYLAESARKR